LAQGQSHLSFIRGCFNMAVHKLPQTQEEMDLFLDDVFRTVFKREYVKEQEQQDALDLKGGKVTLKSVEKK